MMTGMRRVLAFAVMWLVASTIAAASGAACTHGCAMARARAMRCCTTIARGRCEAPAAGARPALPSTRAAAPSPALAAAWIAPRIGAGAAQATVAAAPSARGAPATSAVLRL